jgi:hypothetical protein
MFSTWGWHEWIVSVLTICLALKTAFKMGQYDMMERLDILPRDHTRLDRAEA